MPSTTQAVTGNYFGPIGSLLGFGGIGGGGGGHTFAMANYLRDVFGLDIPRGFTSRKFGVAQTLGNLLANVNAPTGLEDLFGPEFQSRAIGATTERSTQPFAEASRALTSSFLRSGQGGGGQLARGRQQLATAQGQTTGSAIADLLLGLEGQRAQNVMGMESIRQNRLAALANFVNQLQVQQQNRSQQGQASDAAAGAGIGQGAGSIIGALIPLIFCVVAEELFGKEAPETHLARYYVRFLAPAWFRNGYAKHGPQIAELARKDPEFREAIKPLFLWFARTGAEALEGMVA